jgi:uncharacterized protein
VTLNRYVLDANVLVSAVLSPNSTANQAYQKALETGILLASIQTFTEYESVISCYISKSRIIKIAKKGE